MSHDEYFFGLVDQLFERVTDDSGFSLIALFYGLQLAAEVFDLEVAFDDSLISAASERQIQRRVRVSFGLRQVLAADTDADTQARRKVRARFQMSDFIKDVKFRGGHSLQVLLLKPDQISAVAHSADRCVDLSRPLAEQLIDLSGECQPRRRARVADQFIVVINLDFGDTRLLRIVSVF